ncbi:MAG: ATP-dependent DNA helicase RecG [Micrococcales bacterium]
MLLPETSLERILGDRTAKAFARHLNLKTVADLLQHYPRRYYTRGELTPISQLPIGEAVTVVAEIVDLKERRMRGRNGNILEVRITDGNGMLTLTFFNQAWRAKDLVPGKQALFAGKISSFGGQLQLSHPEYELFSEDLSEAEAKRWAEIPIPIYPAASAVPSWKIQKAIEIILTTLEPLVDELPAEVVAAENLLTLDAAIRSVHQPEDNQAWQLARDTIRAHEAFLLQAALLKRRAENAHQSSTSREAKSVGLLTRFDESLPFTLTKGQQDVGLQIATDLAKPHPMNRLLQGEVGSGKTLVALRAMLTVADSGGQSAMIAPTEVLASQHYESILKSLGEDLAKQVGLTLLTGQMNTADRKKAMLQMASGTAQIILGTHALIADKVQFFDLGLVVIDEQHRFGVEQREALRLKGKTNPHVLTMTATPIPRTLAVTVFGDLDVSALTELPGGRQGITSHVVPFSNKALVARVWTRIAEEISNGRQAFVVCPRIDEQDQAEELVEAGGSLEDEPVLVEDAKPKRPPIASAVNMLEALSQVPALKGIELGLLHGRLSSEEKSDVMARFAANEIQLLIATTVIEVGVNVPNATVMVVLDADRFGVSQLHQLRGRVGRGQHPGLALLLTTAEDGSLAMERVKAVASTNDGFALSEIDLELRREGDVLGASQSGGRSSLKLLRVIQDAELIQRMRGYAETTLSHDPTLEKHAALAEALNRQDAARQEYLAKS